MALVGKVRFGGPISQLRGSEYICLGFIVIFLGYGATGDSESGPGIFYSLALGLGVLAIPVAWVVVSEVVIRRRYLEFVGDGTIRIRHGDFVKTAALEDVVFLLPDRSYWNCMIPREVYAVIDGKAVGCPYANAGPFVWSRGMKRFIKDLGENGIEYEFY
jgi:hypothetical protein